MSPFLRPHFILKAYSVFLRFPKYADSTSAITYWLQIPFPRGNSNSFIKRDQERVAISPFHQQLYLLNIVHCGEVRVDIFNRYHYCFISDYCTNFCLHGGECAVGDKCKCPGEYASILSSNCVKCKYESTVCFR